MTRSSRAAPIALVFMALIVTALGIWFFWIRSATVSPSNVMDSQEESGRTTAQHGETGLSKSRPADGNTSQSQANEAQINTKTTDFRITGDDKYASTTEDGFFTTTGVTDLTPEEDIRSFHVGQRVYAYAAIHAPRKETVRITWLDASNKEIPPSAYLDVLVNTGPVGYRIFTYRTFRAHGEYKAQLSNSAGAIIGKVDFKVVE